MVEDIAEDERVNQSLLYEISSVMAQATATGLFVSRGTAQAPDGQVGPSGAPSGTWADVAGLVDIPCMDAPATETSVDVTELKSLAEIMARNCRHVLLDRRYPTLEAGWRAGWRWVMDGIVYDVLGAEPDSQDQMTRMELQEVTV
jgi:hypothetical protein